MSDHTGDQPGNGADGTGFGGQPPAAPPSLPPAYRPGWKPPTPSADPAAGAAPSGPLPGAAPGFTGAGPAAPTAPYGQPAPAAPNPYAANPYPATPYGGPPSVAQSLAASAPDPYVRQERRRGTVGLPPSLGFAVMLLSMPALTTTFYGLMVMLSGVVFSSFDDEELGSDFNDFGAQVGLVGFVVFALGLVGIWAVVSMAAGSTAGRLMSTIYCGLGILAIVGTFVAAPSGGTLVVMFIFLLLPLYCLWAMWGGRSREIF